MIMKLITATARDAIAQYIATGRIWKERLPWGDIQVELIIAPWPTPDHANGVAYTIEALTRSVQTDGRCDTVEQALAEINRAADCWLPFVRESQARLHLPQVIPYPVRIAAPERLPYKDAPEVEQA